MKIIPVEKMSKKAQREYYAQKRNSWGSINPVTRKSASCASYKKRKYELKGATE